MKKVYLLTILIGINASTSVANDRICIVGNLCFTEQDAVYEKNKLVSYKTTITDGNDRTEYTFYPETKTLDYLTYTNGVLSLDSKNILTDDFADYAYYYDTDMDDDKIVHTQEWKGVYSGGELSSQSTIDKYYDYDDQYYHVYKHVSGSNCDNNLCEDVDGDFDYFYDYNGNLLRFINDNNEEYYVTENCKMVDNKGNCTICSDGYTFSDNLCWAAWNKKFYTPAEAAQWLKDDNNIITITFKK